MAGGLEYAEAAVTLGIGLSRSRVGATCTTLSCMHARSGKRQTDGQPS
jgi:hypothetical protein